MITIGQATIHNEFHYGTCKLTIGERGGKTITIERWRRSGKTQTWKTRPNDFTVPIKYDLRSSSYLTQSNAHDFHIPSDCPIRALV